MGGTDPDGISVAGADGLPGGRFRRPHRSGVHLGQPALERPARQACAAIAGTTLTLDEPDLAAFFARHDLQIGAGGGATWERCCIGAPTIAIVVAANQSAVVPALDRLGALRAASLPGFQDGANTKGVPP